MQTRSVVQKLTVASASCIMALIVCSCGVSEQQTATPGNSTHNIFGVWQGVGGVTGADPRFRNSPWPSKPDFTEWGAAELKRWVTSDTPGDCDPWTPVNFMGGNGLFPMQILQGPKVIVFWHEAITQPRQVYVDGRGHPSSEDWLPSFLGHSIGHWEGDTLVVDTVGTNGRGRPMNGFISGAVTSGVEFAPRLPASDQLHVSEHIRLVGDGQFLEDEITVDDPKTYRAPWTIKRYFQRRDDLDVLEYACSDNRRSESEGQISAGAAPPTP